MKDQEICLRSFSKLTRILHVLMAHLQLEWEGLTATERGSVSHIPALRNHIELLHEINLIEGKLCV